MNYLISGGRGFIGSHIVRMLKEKGHSTNSYDTRSGLDIHNLTGKIDALIHLEAMCVIREAIQQPILCHYRNATLTANLLEFCRLKGIKNFIYFSSSRVEFEQNNIYTATKKYGELLCKAYNECYGINYKIIRPSTVFGPGDKTNRIIPRFIKQALNNEDIIIYGDENKALDITYIDDFVRAFEYVMEDDWNKEYNIANGNAVKVKEIAEHIINNTNSNSKLRFEQAEKSQPQEVTCNIDLITKLGYLPSYSWRPKIDKTINWVKEWLKHKSA